MQEVEDTASISKYCYKKISAQKPTKMMKTNLIVNLLKELLMLPNLQQHHSGKYHL